jgi:hypothetical protein
VSSVELRSPKQAGGFPLIDVIHENEHGEVIIQRREADGTIVLLACEEISRIDQVSGPIISPQQPGQPPSRPGGVFPTLARASEEPLRLDISPLPEGILQFDPTVFGREAIIALRAGERDLMLTPERASSFGYRGLLDQSATA